ncbi:AAA family ATPase [Bacillus thuringiensis]|nr:AAA family ATPase [Bacillus thuringiensis]
MKIVVAGAGAGKTTSMAQVVLDRLEEVTNGKFIYVITYTNAARDRIREKIIELNGCIPNRLFIETIHVFLLREFVFPFHHLLYDQQFTKASQMKLPDNLIFKSRKIKELADSKIVHVEKVTETAKWIICKKTRDTIQIKERRRKILDIVSKYLDSIFIDEAQDMDKHLLEVIQALDRENINLYLVGDPKQDLRGRNAFKALIDKYIQHVEYIPENHRCPISHVQLANSYISADEKQRPQKALLGELGYVFESDIEITNFIDTVNWDYAFIYKKNNRFITHINDKNLAKQNLAYELKSIVKKSNINERLVDKFIYDVQKAILKDLPQLNNFKIFSMLEESLSIKLTRQDKGKLADAFNLNCETPTNEGVLVNSIDSIKGLEGDKCLFILTTDLAPYLFGRNGNQNKMLNYLYVALTRAKQKLVFIITTEVEEKYSRETVNTYFQETLSIKEERITEAILT